MFSFFIGSSVISKMRVHTYYLLFNLMSFFLSAPQCIDIDECLHSSCGPGARCSNFPGGYHCECPPGYTGDAFTVGCRDADECATRPCGVDALCSNVDGSYTCTCPPGFIGDPFKLCSGKSSPTIGDVLSGGLCELCLIRRYKTQSVS